MKVSVLLPSLNPQLAARAIASLKATGTDPSLLEIVVCSPTKIEGENVVWVEDASPSGNNPAIQKAFEKSTGDVIIAFTDDAVTHTGWLAKALNAFVPEDRKARKAKKSFILGLGYTLAGSCFGHYYANFPMASRRTVEAHREDYYAHTAHWGDVSFSMAVWLAGGRVKMMNSVVLEFVADRMGADHSPHKASAFMKDTTNFVKKFGPTIGKGWPIANFRDYNIDLEASTVVRFGGTICQPDRNKFLAEVLGQAPTDKPAGELEEGMWLMPTHLRPERCQKVLDAIVNTGSTTRGLVMINGGEQPEGYARLRLPNGWQVVKWDKDVPVCDMYRQFFIDYPNLAWYGILPDDVVPETPGWDKFLVEKAGTHRISSANDGWQAPRRIHGATVIGGAIPRALGFLCPPDIAHNYFDDFLEALGHDLKLWTCLMDVMTRHEHPGNGTGPNEELYKKNLDRIASDKPHFEAWFNQRHSDYQKIAAAFPQIGQISADLSKRKVMIFTPSGSGRLTYQYVHSLTSTIQALLLNGIQYRLLLIPNESLIMRARNAALRTFLESDCTDLFMIDDDMGWDANSFIRMMLFEKDIVGAAGPRKSEERTFCCNFKSEQIARDQKNGLISVKEMGSAFMILSRSAIERMIRAYGKDLIYVDNVSGLHYVNLFDTRLVDKHLWSEDYTFCQRATAIGIDIWVDPTVSLAHVGTKEYTGALMDMLTRVNQPQPVAGAAE